MGIGAQPLLDQWMWPTRTWPRFVSFALLPSDWSLMIGPFVAGFVVAEGSFIRRDRTRFSFAVALGSADAGMCEVLRAFFGVGTIVRSARRKAHYQDEVRYQVTGTEQLAAVVVPFMDAHLPRDSYKRQQYETWREALMARRATRQRQPLGRACEVDGCPHRARAKRLCRHHYYCAFGR